MKLSFNRVFPWVFGLIFCCILAVWGVGAFIVYQGYTFVRDNGLRGTIEQVWCGRNEVCTLPSALEVDEE